MTACRRCQTKRPPQGGTACPRFVRIRAHILCVTDLQPARAVPPLPNSSTDDTAAVERLQQAGLLRAEQALNHARPHTASRRQGGAWHAATGTGGADELPSSMSPAEQRQQRQGLLQRRVGRCLNGPRRAIWLVVLASLVFAFVGTMSVKWRCHAGGWPRCAREPQPARAASDGQSPAHDSFSHEMLAGESGVCRGLTGSAGAAAPALCCG
jgi:hypothetical protein